EEHHPEQLVPKRFPGLAVEIDREDVLVLLRRVLGKTDAAVGAPIEPLRMFAYPGVVRGTLECEIERYLHPEPLGRGHEAPEVFERTEGGVHGRVASLWPTDRPRASWVTGFCGEGFVPPLAARQTDRMDRGKVDDIEPHALHVRQALDAVGESAVASRAPRLRARGELVPGGEAGPGSVDHPLELTVESGSIPAQLQPGDNLPQGGLEQDAEPRFLRVRRCPSGYGAVEEGSIGPRRAGSRLSDEPGALKQFTA